MKHPNSLVSFTYLLKTSRPGLWFATVWLYLLPTGQMDQIFQSWIFWFGLFYVTFPLNLMVYGWNDAVDAKTDAVNPRKDSFWFGALGSPQQLQVLWKYIAWVQLITYPVLVYFGGWNVLLIFFGFLIINGLYNLPKHGLRSRPPLELLCQIGYLLIAPLSIYINQTENLPHLTYLYLFLFAMQSHLMGEVMDIEPDRKAGRKTTATLIGMHNTKLLIIGIVAVEVLLLVVAYDEYIFAAMLGLGLLWLILDLFIIYKTKTYTIKQMKLFAFLSNITALVSMLYVWYSACLLQIPN